MFHHYHREYNEFCSEYTTTESESYTNLDQFYSLKTGSPDRTTQKTKIQKYLDTIQTTTNIQECITIQQLQQATLQDDHIQQLKDYIIRGWPENKNQILKDIHTYWTF